LSVNEVQEAYAKAKVDGELEVGLIVGDEVESIPLKCRWPCCADRFRGQGNRGRHSRFPKPSRRHWLAKKVKVVWHSSYDHGCVIKELAIQTSDLVDPATAQEVGPSRSGASTI